MVVPDFASSRRRLLITGEFGFVGRNIECMRDELREEHGWELVVSSRPYDLNDPESLAALVEDTRPHGVIHLAGNSFVPDSFRDPEGTFRVNTLGTLHLLQGLKASGFSGSFLYVSTGDVYGRLSPEDLPVSESRIPRPLNPYAVSKVATEALCYQWAQSGAFERIVIARPFNHVGIGQREDFVVSSMARQVARIRSGRQRPVIDVGDIDVTRDFLDVADVVRAYMMLLAGGENGETYNVCSGCERSIRSIIGSLLGMANVEADLHADQSRFRLLDQRRSAGDNRKLIAATGWRPSVSFDDTLKNILDDWESREQ